jgi:hypothetical protein
MSSAQLRNGRHRNQHLSVYQTARVRELFQNAGGVLQVEPSRIEEMVQQGRKMEVANALMERLRDIPDPPCRSSSTSLTTALSVQLINWRPTLPRMKRPTLAWM